MENLSSERASALSQEVKGMGVIAAGIIIFVPALAMMAVLKKMGWTE